MDYYVECLEPTGRWCLVDTTEDRKEALERMRNLEIATGKAHRVVDEDDEVIGLTE